MNRNNPGQHRVIGLNSSPLMEDTHSLTLLRPKCPECGSDHIADRWATRRIPGPKEILWCGRCGFGWQHPTPTPEEISNYYRNQTPYVIQGENEKQEGYKHRIDQLAQLMPKRGKLLDVGSGLGHFLHMARSDGWQVAGIEPQNSAADYCRERFGITPHIGHIWELDLPPRSFDVVTLWDVLEHVHRPSRFLDHCFELVAPRGLLVIAVPNASGWPARLFKGHWRYVMFTHLNYFSRAGIGRLLAERHGRVETERHTIKAQSLMQGLESWLPFDFGSEQIIRMGRQHTIERDRPEQHRSPRTSLSPGWRKRALQGIRALILKLNLMPLGRPVGDLMDLYCRKET